MIVVLSCRVVARSLCNNVSSIDHNNNNNNNNLYKVYNLNLATVI